MCLHSDLVVGVYAHTHTHTHTHIHTHMRTHTHRELLEMIAQFEQREFSSSSSSQQPSTPSHRHTLEPLNTSGGEKLLNMVSK